MTEDQREAWRKALAAKARQQRSQRYGPQARGVRILKGRAFTGAGMIRLPPADPDAQPSQPAPAPSPPGAPLHAARPNVGKHPFTGRRRQEHYGNLLRGKRMALTRGQRGGSMYAVFVEVNPGELTNDQARQAIEGTAVPMAREAGAQAGYWLSAEGGRGIAMICFDSGEAARRAADQLKVGEAPPGAPPGGDVTFRTVEVREVLASL